jgi:hypothetical protein
LSIVWICAPKVSIPSMKRVVSLMASSSGGDDIRGATDFGPRGGQATALGLLADADTTRPRAQSDTIHIRCRGAKSFVDDLGQSRGGTPEDGDLGSLDSKPRRKPEQRCGEIKEVFSRLGNRSRENHWSNAKTAGNCGGKLRRQTLGSRQQPWVGKIRFFASAKERGGRFKESWTVRLGKSPTRWSRGENRDFDRVSGT